jgi:hypothetical protein
MKNVLRTIAFGAALTVAATAVPSFAAIVSPAIQDQGHDRSQEQQHQEQQHQDYSKNRYYKIGNREGYQDYKNKTQRTEHNHPYRNDTDRQAHDYGYQQGLKGQRGYQQNSDPH